MKTIHKRLFSLGAAISVTGIPKGARVLSAAAQGEDVALWYEFTEGEPSPFDTMTVYLVPTGNGPPDDATFVGTVLFMNGKFVVHAYVRITPA